MATTKSHLKNARALECNMVDFKPCHFLLLYIHDVQLRAKNITGCG